jgi:hypothetical protein
MMYDAELGACPIVTLLLRRTVRGHQQCSRLRKILNVFITRCIAKNNGSPIPF